MARCGRRPTGHVPWPLAGRPGTCGARALDRLERRHRSLGPPWLARRNSVSSGVSVARRRGLAERRGLAGRSGLAGGRGFALRELFTRRECLSKSHPSWGWHGLLRRPGRRAGRPPAGAHPRRRVRSCLVSGLRRRRRAGRRRPGLDRPGARCTTRIRLPECLASTLRSRRPHGARGGVGTEGPGRSRRAGRARIARNIDQAAGRIHRRRIQHPPPLTAWSRWRRRTVPVTGGPAAGRTSVHPGLGERENQQRNQADRETGHAESHAQVGLARGHGDPAHHDHPGTEHRHGGDKPHPCVRGGIRAHRSTIASWFAPRKPYGQVRRIRVATEAVSAVPAAAAAVSRAGADDTLWA